jgi:recombination directionality factor gp3-like protein
VRCPRPEQCELAARLGCRLITRLYVQIDVKGDEKRSVTGDTSGEGQAEAKPDGYVSDPLSAFVLRSMGYYTGATLRAKLEMLHALLKGTLIGVPLSLRLRQKSSRSNLHAIFYYVDLVPAVNLAEAVRRAREAAQQAAGCARRKG